MVYSCDKPRKYRVVVFTLTLVLFAGCMRAFDFVGLIDGETGLPLTIEPSSAYLSVDEVITFKAAGGMPPYKFSISKGEGVIDEQSGSFTAPSAPGNTTVRVTDAYGFYREAAVEVAGTLLSDVNYLVIAISPLPETAYLGEAISQSFTFSNIGTDDGSKKVYWTAYVSTDGAPDGGETIVATGSTSALVSESTSAPVPVKGAWPLVDGTYRLVVKLEAEDDIDSSNNIAVSIDSTVVSGYPDVDYLVSSVVNSDGGDGTTGTADGALAGEFQFANEGTSNGSHTVFWQVYVSTDQVYGAGDLLVAGGSSTALTGEATSTWIPFEGTWPSINNTYYLIVRLDASDDGNTANNTGVSAAVIVTGGSTSEVNYVIDAVSNDNSAGKAGDTIDERFDLRNAGTGDGSHDVHWTAYASANKVLGAGDSIVDSGAVTGGLAAEASLLDIPIGGNWPHTAGTYWLIVSVSAGDETQTADNTGVSGAFTLAPLDIDYEVVTITAANPSAAVSSEIAETFTFANTGTEDGVANVYWYVYSSTDQMLDAGDLLQASGILPPLAAGTTSSSIAISGEWPSAANIYYLIVELYASDDSTSINNRKASDAFMIIEPDTVDYIITGITSTYPTITTGSPVSEKLSVQNIGDTAGEALGWSAYASAVPVWDEYATLVSSGTTQALAAGAIQANISIGGSWPSRGEWYLIVKLDAADDVTTNNEACAGPFTVYDPPDYVVDAVSLPFLTKWALVEGSLSALAGGALGEFTIREIAGHDGNQVITWTVYASKDQLIDGADTVIASGSIPPLTVSSPSELITFDGVAPSASGHYYFLIHVQAGDDADVTNDLYASAVTLPVMDPRGFDQTTNVETDTKKDASIQQAKDFAILLDSGKTTDTVYIEGIIDEAGGWDYFKITTGSMVTQLDITLTWDTGANDLDLYYRDEGGAALFSSTSPAPDSEPEAPPWTVTFPSGNTVHYVEVRVSGGNIGTGESYKLTITGK